jgi:nitrate reductase NapE component
MAGAKTENEQLWQVVGKLEATADIHREQIAEIFTIQRQHVATNAETAALIKAMAEQQKAAHTPDTCPQKPKIDRMWELFRVIVAILGALIAMGIVGKFGAWLWERITHIP